MPNATVFLKTGYINAATFSFDKQGKFSLGLLKLHWKFRRVLVEFREFFKPII